MQPPKPGRTRTAAPQMPSTWWMAPRIRTYLLFDATGIIYYIVGFIALRLIWALGAGPDSWNMTAPDSVIDLANDILGVILQFNHSCA